MPGTRGTSRKKCPLCGTQVSGSPDDLNRHFENDCTWRHTSKAPSKSSKS